MPLPTNPTKQEVIDRYWFEFLRYQKAELEKRKTSGWGVPSVDLDEEAFWNWLITEKPEVFNDQL